MVREAGLRNPRAWLAWGGTPALRRPCVASPHVSRPTLCETPRCSPHACSAHAQAPAHVCFPDLSDRVGVCRAHVCPSTDVSLKVASGLVPATIGSQVPPLRPLSYGFVEIHCEIHLVDRSYGHTCALGACVGRADAAAPRCGSADFASAAQLSARHMPAVPSLRPFLRAVPPSAPVAGVCCFSTDVVLSGST